MKGFRFKRPVKRVTGKGTKMIWQKPKEDCLFPGSGAIHAIGRIFRAAFGACQ